MIKGVYGVNIAVDNLEEAAKRFEEILNVKPVSLKDEDFAFPDLVGAQFDVGGVALTVVGSKTDDTSIAKFVEKRGEGLFLLSLLVDDIERDVEKMKERGIKFVTDIKEGAYGKVSFAHPKSFYGVQLEILQVTSQKLREKIKK